MKDRNGPATIARCKEPGKCQFIDVINIFLFTVSLYIAGTFVCYILHQAELLGAQNIYLHQAELLGGQFLINDRLTLNIISNDIIQLEIMQVGQLSADTFAPSRFKCTECPNTFYLYILKTNAPYIIDYYSFHVSMIHCMLI